MLQGRRDDDDDDEYAQPIHGGEDSDTMSDDASDVYSSVAGRVRRNDPSSRISTRPIPMNGLTNSYANTYLTQLGNAHMHDIRSMSSRDEQTTLHGHDRHHHQHKKRKRRREGEDDDDDDDENVNFKPISLQEIQFKTRNELKGDDHYSTGINYSYTEPGCIGCQCGILMKRTLNIGINGFDIIAGMINQELFRLNFMEIMIQIKNIYDEHIKHQVAELTKTPPRNWSLDAIRYHLVHCVCDPAIDIKYKHYDSTFIYEGILKKIAKVSRTDPDDITYKMSEIRKFIAISQFQNANLTRNPEKSMGFQAGITPGTYKSERLSHLNKR